MPRGRTIARWGVRVAGSLLAGVVVSWLVAAGIGVWWGDHAVLRGAMPDVHCYIEGAGRIASIDERRTVVSRRVIWAVIEKPEAAMYEAMRSAMEHEVEGAMERYGEMANEPEARGAAWDRWVAEHGGYGDPAELPVWLSLWTDPGWTESVAPGSAIAMDVGVGWPCVAFHLSGDAVGLRARPAVVRGGYWWRPGPGHGTRLVAWLPIFPGVLIDSAVYGLAAYGLCAVLPSSVRRAVRRRRGRCVRCGYDRRGLGDGALCPECGAGA